MKNYFVIALVLCLAACKEEKAQVGKSAPPIEAVTLTGESVSLEKFKGKAVYLGFWSVGCGYCLAEMPHLNDMKKKYGDRVEVIYVNLDPDSVSKDQIEAVIAKQAPMFTIARDVLGITRDRYPIIGYPTSFMIDQAGVIQKKQIGSLLPPKMDALFKETGDNL